MVNEINDVNRHSRNAAQYLAIGLLRIRKGEYNKRSISLSGTSKDNTANMIHDKPSLKEV